MCGILSILQKDMASLEQEQKNVRKRWVDVKRQQKEKKDMD